MFKRPLPLLCVFLLLLLAALCACQSSQPSEPVVRIAYLPITHALPVLMERELKADNAPRVELVRYGSWPELMDALNTGRVDGASVLSVLALKAHEQGIHLRMAALGHRGGNVIVAAPHINASADLRGKTIAVPHRQSSHHLLVRQLLDNAGMSVDDIRLIELSPPEMPAALSRGDIDAYCVAEPFGAQAVTLNAGKVLFHSEDLWPGSICCSLVFNAKFLQNNPELAREYLDAYLRAGKALKAAPASARTLAARELRAAAEVLDMSLGWISFDNLHILPDDYRALTDLMVRYGLSTTPPTYEQAVMPGAPMPGSPADTTP